jgi:very-short-patch-repair endonuclease
MKSTECFQSFNYESDSCLEALKEVFDAYPKCSVKKLQRKIFAFGPCSQTQIKFWTDRFWSEEEAIEKVRQVQSKNSKIRHSQPHNESYLKTFNTRKEFYMENGHTEEEAVALLKERQNTLSYEKNIEKYGEEDGIKKVKQRNINWLKSLYSNNDMEIINKKKSVTLDTMIKKYGIKEGKDKYDKYLKSKMTELGKSSKAAEKVFIDFFYSYKDYKTYLGIEKLNEYYLYDRNNKRVYFYDFVIRDLKLIFEYNGNHVHPNKEKLTETEWKNWRCAFTKETADEKYNKDQTKIKFAESEGFKVVELWDSDSTEYNKSIVNSVILKTLETFQK